MKNITKTIKWMLIVSGLVFMSACGNNKGGSGGSSGTGTVVTPGVCANCSGITQPVLLSNFESSSTHSDFPVSIVNGQIFGTAGGFTSTAQTAYNVYSGPVSLQGTFRVSQVIGDEYARQSYGSSGCVIQTGDYALTTVQVGNIANATNLAIPELAAGNIRLQLSSGMMWKDTNGAVRVLGTLTIKSVGGRQCGPFATSIQ